ncbi:MAG: FesM [Blastocatellia bacterium]|nr:MAG: FesM [Blastocatellia bacterium]
MPSTSATVRTPISTDILRWPVVGRALRWRHARTTLQLVLLVGAAVIVLHGLLGPPLASNNLATVLTWVHYRGLLVLALLAVGNAFCTGCPFVLVRDAGRRLRRPTLRWPRRLRTKWIAIALFVFVLFSYELFDLWALPRATAYLVLVYFGSALVIDLAFSGATFCKYLCPIGQFNFAASTVSPLELKVREESVCRSCRTADCIRGRREPAVASNITQNVKRKAPETAPLDVSRSMFDVRRKVVRRPVQRGCELGLFLPLKVGNMDCTFCLDCVQACPHDNVALVPRLPAAELSDPRRRSGIGRFAQRHDIAALALLFAFGSMVNAFAMTAPSYTLERWLSRTMDVGSEAPVLAAVFLVGLCAVPLVLVGGAAILTRKLAGAERGSISGILVNYAYALVPFGFGMWLAHYCFHLLTSVLTVVPITQSAAIDILGWPALGEPHWRWAGLRPGAVFPIQLGFIFLGTIGSLAVAYQVSQRDYPDRPGPTTVPWAVVAAGLASLAVWILAQPMEMRGLGFLG